MSRKNACGFRALLALLCGCLLATARADDGIAPLLQQADAYRLAEKNALVDVEVDVLRHGEVDKQRQYAVYVKPGRRSLVVMKTPIEIGQKVLMLGEQFWLLMPDTQRPLRITASQKLLGEAAVGDVASLTWSEDYDGTLAGEEAIDGRPCLHLSLQARRPVTYSRIELWLDKASREPVKADFFVGSDKRAKEARFELSHLAGRRRVTRMVLIDNLQAGKQTVVRYLAFREHQLGDESFNPAALVRRVAVE
ncbi:MAG: hypothetical protein H6R10_1946 [Rhodocyclaceae bacterium]|nr:hypothetical protein [Rhodocyclaceae bacterium]